MKKHRLASFIPTLRAAPRGAVVLNPLAEKILTPQDRMNILRYGLVVIDCSWEKAQEVLNVKRRREQRRLPCLLAANPQRYGRPHELSSAEAIVAALYICNLKSEADNILRIFSWGHSFLTLNKNPLLKYSQASNEEEILEIEKEYFPRY